MISDQAGLIEVIASGLFNSYGELSPAEALAWLGKKGISPEKATLPLCCDCNGALGRSLEGPVAEIFRAIDRGESLSDRECELLVRWMWKFEGLEWHLNFAGAPHARYTEAYTLIERVTTSEPFDQVRAEMALAISRIKANDEGFEDWPIGLDTPPSPIDALCMSGVFGRIALISSRSIFAKTIPAQFGIYEFGRPPADTDRKIFLPPMGFETATEAIVSTVDVSAQLLKLHEELAREQQGVPRLILESRRRVELPPV